MTQPSEMANIYYKLIVAERKTIDQVPEVLRSEVQALLDKHNSN